MALQKQNQEREAALSRCLIRLRGEIAILEESGCDVAAVHVATACDVLLVELGGRI